MRRAILALACVLSLLLGAQPAFGQDAPTSGQLVEEPGAFDGTVIDFTGEVVGEVMDRPGGAWVHLNDDAYMERNVEEGAELGGYNSGQAVWAPGDLAEAITRAGDYHNQGDIVLVTGVFNAACPEHGGDMDIHAQELVVVTAGHAVVDPVAPWKPILALILAAFAGGLFAAHTWQRARD